MSEGMPMLVENWQLKRACPGKLLHAWVYVLRFCLNMKEPTD